MERADTKFASQLDHLLALPGHKSSHHSEPVFTWLGGEKVSACLAEMSAESMYVQPRVSPIETQEVMSFTERSYP